LFFEKGFLVQPLLFHIVCFNKFTEV
jgi:hypothetical protein